MLFNGHHYKVCYDHNSDKKNSVTTVYRLLPKCVDQPRFLELKSKAGRPESLCMCGQWSVETKQSARIGATRWMQTHTLRGVGGLF